MTTFNNLSEWRHVGTREQILILDTQTLVAGVLWSFGKRKRGEKNNNTRVQQVEDVVLC